MWHPHTHTQMQHIWFVGTTTESNMSRTLWLQSLWTVAQIDLDFHATPTVHTCTESKESLQEQGMLQTIFSEVDLKLLTPGVNMTSTLLFKVAKPLNHGANCFWHSCNTHAHSLTWSTNKKLQTWTGIVALCQELFLACSLLTSPKAKSGSREKDGLNPLFNTGSMGHSRRTQITQWT